MMKNPQAIKQQLIGCTIVAWGLVIARLGFNAYPNAMPTWGLFLMAIGVSTLLYLYPRVRNFSPGTQIALSLPAKLAIGTVMTCAAMALAWYVVSLKGATMPKRLAVVGMVFLFGLFALQWLTDRSQF
ncbi:MAG TPA: hypothetical protein VK819_15740 [Acidobacteriaceae bacterium]|jgi:hypothetical protein|nr:hypothetical protein [Acidobacteriaceae bacterium]